MRKNLTHLQQAEVKGRRLVELTSKKYLDRARKNAALKALDHLKDAFFIHDVPFDKFKHGGPRVDEKNYYGENFDTPWKVVDVYTHNFETPDFYYDLMGFAGACKDPFCDAKCPLTLVSRFDEPFVQLLFEETSGVAICKIEIFSPVPSRIITHLREKGIIKTSRYAGSEGGSSTSINCPTH